MLAEEEGRDLPAPGDARPAPRNLPKWAMPLGAAAAVLLVLGAGLAFWPGQQAPQSAEDPGSMLTNPVWLPEKERERQEQIAAAEAQQQIAAAKAQEAAAATKAQTEIAAAQAPNTDMIGGGRPGMEQTAETEGSTEMIVGGNPPSPLAAGDPDFRACEKLSGDDGIAACDRAIASGKFAGRDLSYLYSDRGFLLHAERSDLEAALADLNKATRHRLPRNFYAFWNRGAVLRPRATIGRAQEDFNTALALNPDTASKAKIEEALNAVMPAPPGAPNAKPRTRLSSPIRRGSGGQELQGQRLCRPGFPADAMPASPPAGPVDTHRPRIAATRRNLTGS